MSMKNCFSTICHHNPGVHYNLSGLTQCGVELLCRQGLRLLEYIILLDRATYLKNGLTAHSHVMTDNVRHSFETKE